MSDPENSRLRTMQSAFIAGMNTHLRKINSQLLMRDNFLIYESFLSPNGIINCVKGVDKYAEISSRTGNRWDYKSH